MSVDTRLNASLPSLDTLSALDRAGLDGRQPQLDGGNGVQRPSEVGPLEFGEPARAPAVDAGELVLNAPAWDEDAPRLLAAGDFELGGSDRSQDLDTGVGAMVAPLG